MKRPPLLMNVRIKDENSRFGFYIPLPLFLVILIALALFIALSPLILLAVIILWPSGWGKWIINAISGFCNVFCSMQGLKVDIRGPKQIVKVSVI